MVSLATGLNFNGAKVRARSPLLLARIQRNPKTIVEKCSFLETGRSSSASTAADSFHCPRGGWQNSSLGRSSICYPPCVGLHCLLRTGELLALQYKAFEFSSTCGRASLLSSKSALRTGTEEAVFIRDPFVLNLLRGLVAVDVIKRAKALVGLSSSSQR